MYTVDNLFSFPSFLLPCHFLACSITCVQFDTNWNVQNFNCSAMILHIFRFEVPVLDCYGGSYTCSIQSILMNKLLDVFQLKLVYRISATVHNPCHRDGQTRRELLLLSQPRFRTHSPINPPPLLALCSRSRFPRDGEFIPGDKIRQTVPRKTWHVPMF